MNIPKQKNIPPMPLPRKGKDRIAVPESVLYIVYEKDTEFKETIFRESDGTHINIIKTNGREKQLEIGLCGRRYSQVYCDSRLIHTMNCWLIKAACNVETYHEPEFNFIEFNYDFFKLPEKSFEWENIVIKKLHKKKEVE